MATRKGAPNDALTARRRTVVAIFADQNERSARITKNVVETLQPESCRFTAWDTHLKGFVVRLRPVGTLSYVVRYRTFGGTDRLLVLARHGVITAEEVRERAMAVLADVSSGADSQMDKVTRREELTLGGLFDL